MPASRPDYRRYRLDRNPFAQNELDPIACAQDRERLRGLDGFVDLDPIEDYLWDAVEARRPAFVVVSGRDYSGRTSLANVVIDSYRDLRGIPAERVLRVSVEPPGHLMADWLLKAMDELRAEVTMTGPQLSRQLKDQLAGIEAVQEGLYGPYRIITNSLGVELAGRAEPWMYAMRFERVPAASLITDVRSAFRQSQTIVVFIHQAAQHSATAELSEIRAALGPDGRVVRLEPLRGAQVKLLAKERWEEEFRLENPFDLDGVESIFRVDEPIKSALAKLSKLLHHQLRSVESAEPWPDNRQLAMSRHWLEANVEFAANWDR